MRIRALREAAGLSQTELGIRIGCDRTSIVKWESEVVLPRSRDLPMLAKALGCSIDDLYEQEDAAVECDLA